MSTNPLVYYLETDFWLQKYIISCRFCKSPPRFNYILIQINVFLVKLPLNTIKLRRIQPLSDEEQIHETKYLPTELVPQLEGDKNTIVDVLCTDARGRIIPQPANCGLGYLHYVIERVMNVYQPVFPLFIWSFQEKSVILQ